MNILFIHNCTYTWISHIGTDRSKTRILILLIRLLVILSYIFGIPFHGLNLLHTAIKLYS
jgi:hypothetical protein